MNILNPSIEEMCRTTERQQFDRKSARMDAPSMAIPIIALANADGGLIAVGIEDNGEITGIDAYTKHIDELLRAPFDFCKPSVPITTETVACTDSSGQPNHILLLRIPQSSVLHANHKDEVYLRVGDKSKKLNFDERLQIMYAKGERYYEDEPVYGSGMEDIDLDFVADYCQRIGYTKSAEEYIRQNNDYISKVGGREEMSGAAILLFGKRPQRFFQRARVRFIRYEGTEAKVGAQMNVIKDRIFTGRILEMVEQSVEFVRNQIKEHTYLGADGRFVTEPEYPEFAWKELIVNAIAHRDYSIKGTDIQIKMFEDHLTVESPGTLPGIVRLNNMRQVHFSRNPKIAELLHAYEYVGEFGEGVDRMYGEMEAAGLPAPEYKVEAFMLLATIKNAKAVTDQETDQETDQVTDQVTEQVTEQATDQATDQATEQATDQETDQATDQETDQATDQAPNKNDQDTVAEKIISFCAEPKSKSEIMRFCGYKHRGSFTATHLMPLLASGELQMTLPDQPTNRNQKYVVAGSVSQDKIKR